jgi:hypothetical protein
MIGGIMPKLSALRWSLGIVATLLLIAGVSLSWGGGHPWRVTSPLSAVAALFGGDAYGGELHELELLQAALQRIGAELNQQANPRALASLRAEREAVMQRLREVASRVPADSLSPGIWRLIEPAAASAAAPGNAPGPVARPVEEAAPTRPAGELRAGLRPPAPVTDFSGLVLDQRPPWPLFTRRKPPHRAAPAAPGAASAPPDRAETR